MTRARLRDLQKQSRDLEQQIRELDTKAKAAAMNGRMDQYMTLRAKIRTLRTHEMHVLADISRIESILNTN